MAAKPCVFLDTSFLFAAVLSETGGSRLILKLGESGTVGLWVGSRVLQEAAENKALFVLLLDRAKVSVGPEPDGTALAQARTVIDYPPDARIAAEALAVDADYLMSLDRMHLVGKPRASELPFPIGTSDDFLAWFRERLQEGA